VLGYVVDFVELSFGGVQVPTFNLADSFVYSGFALFLIDIVRNWKQRRQGGL
jgi:lipoprotein signal peptidase